MLMLVLLEVLLLMLVLVLLEVLMLMLLALNIFFWDLSAAGILNIL